METAPYGRERAVECTWQGLGVYGVLAARLKGVEGACRLLGHSHSPLACESCVRRLPLCVLYVLPELL